MSTAPDNAGPFYDTEAAKYLRARIDELAPVRTQREIATEAGFRTPNVLSMIKTGHMRIPADKVHTLAKALQIDPTEMLRLFIAQSMDEKMADVVKATGYTVGQWEYDLIKTLRGFFGNKTPSMTKSETIQVIKLVKAHLKGASND